MKTMLNCEEASRLLSESQDRALSSGERLRLRFHLAMCKPCGNVEGQLDFLRKAMTRLAQGDTPPGGGAAEP